jgi:hypothetical protein
MAKRRNERNSDAGQLMDNHRSIVGASTKAVQLDFRGL